MRFPDPPEALGKLRDSVMILALLTGFTLLIVAMATDVLGVEAPAGMEEDIEKFDQWLGE